VLAGRVLSPGRGGLVSDHGQVALGGAAVDLFLCEVRKPCLATGQPVASSVTDPDGRFRIVVSAAVVQGTLPVVLARVSPTFVLRAPVLVIPIPAARAIPRQAGDAAETVVDSISEAAVRLLQEEGFGNYTLGGIAAVVQAVEAANSDANFADLTPEQAVDQAQTTAANDSAVQMALADNRLTPTPTTTATPLACVGDCSHDGQVTVNELIQMVNIALGNAVVSTCTAGDANGDGEITVNEIVAGVNSALNGCPPNCTPPPCKPGEVFSCPESCPGGCGTLCATATKSPATTPTPTPTGTSPATTPTSTACAGEPPRVDPVTSPTDLLQQTITGFGRPLTDIGGSHSISVTTPAGVFGAHTSSQAKFAATVDLVPGVNDLTVCIYSVCGFVPCTSYDLNGNPLQIIVNAPTPTDTPRTDTHCAGYFCSV